MKIKQVTLTLTIATLCAIQAISAVADELKPNKRLFPQTTAKQSLPVMTNTQSAVTPINPTPINPIAVNPTVVNPGTAKALNPQPFPPIAKNPVVSAPTLKNMDQQIPKPIGASNNLVIAPLDGVKLNTGLGGTLIDVCNGKPCIISVNNKNVSNTTFKPGTRYQIVGKKFGTARGDVILNIDGDVAVKLDVTAWRDEEIIAYFKNDFGGKPNSNNVALFIDVPNTPRIIALNSQRGKFEALIVKQSITFAQIPQNAINFDKGAFGEPVKDANGYAFYTSTRSANQTIDGIKHQFTDKIKLNFINPNFKILDVNTVFGRIDTNGSRCAGCGAGSGGVYVYGTYGWELKGNNELWVSRAVWHNHVSPSMDWTNTLRGAFAGPVGAIIGAATGIDGKKGGNEFLSSVDKLEIIVEGPKGINPIK